METTQFENDAFLKLLTDALRAGPGSPQWHEAVNRLRAMNPTEADEYRMLVTAREHLESGREFRSVRPGPGFTRKLMDGVEQQAVRNATAIPWANLIAVLAAAAALTVIVLVAVLVYRGGTDNPTINDLAGTYFSKAPVAADFAQGRIPAEWKKFGLEPVISERHRALRAGARQDSGREFTGGGICLASPIAASEQFAVETTIRLSRANGGVDLQVFITQDPAFDSNPKTTTSSEFVADVINGQLSLFKPGPKLAGSPIKISEADRPKNLVLLIKMDRQFVIVEADGQRLYEGEHGLSADKPRWPGVRFLIGQNADAGEQVTVPSIRILKP